MNHEINAHSLDCLLKYLHFHVRKYVISTQMRNMKVRILKPSKWSECYIGSSTYVVFLCKFSYHMVDISCYIFLSVSISYIVFIQPVEHKLQTISTSCMLSTEHLFDSLSVNRKTITQRGRYKADPDLAHIHNV